MSATQALCRQLPRHPLERLLAPIDPTRLARSVLGLGRGPADALLVECRVGSGEPGWLRAADWRLFARIGDPGDRRRRRGGRAVHHRWARRRLSYLAPRRPRGRAVRLRRRLRRLHGRALGGLGRPAATEPPALNAFYRVKRAVPRRRPARRPPAADPLAGQPGVPALAVRRQRRRPAALLCPLRADRRGRARAPLSLVLAARRARRGDPHPRRRVRGGAAQLGSDRRPRAGSVACGPRSTSSPTSTRSTGGSSRSCAGAASSSASTASFTIARCSPRGRSSSASSPICGRWPSAWASRGFAPRRPTA